MTDSVIRTEDEWASTYGDIGTQSRKELRELPIRALVPWTDAEGRQNPFPYTEEQQRALVDSIKEYGVIEPIHVRPMQDGRFQIIAGHHRVLAAKTAEMSTIPALVEDVNDNTAAVRMVDSNLVRRENVDPVSLGHAYRIKLEAMKREGKPNEMDDMGDHSRASVYRYIRLTYLTGSMAALATKRKIAVVPAAELSYLDAETQQIVADAISTKAIKAPNKAMAKEIRNMFEAGELNYDTLVELCNPDDEEDDDLVFSRFKEFFPDAVSDDELSDRIYSILKKMQREKQE